MIFLIKWRYGEGDTYSDDEGYYYDPSDRFRQYQYDEDEEDEEDEDDEEEEYDRILTKQEGGEGEREGGEGERTKKGGGGEEEIKEKERKIW